MRGTIINLNIFQSVMNVRVQVIYNHSTIPLSVKNNHLSFYRPSSNHSVASKLSTKVGDLEFGDCDDLDSDLADLDLGPKLSVNRPVQNLIDARPITLQTAIVSHSM